jgi:manganese transport protein
VSLRNRFGPGLLVTAAFIGPGTIATASSAGAQFGYTLLWALLFSVMATAALQDMAARLGLVTRAGLAEALRTMLGASWPGKVALGLVVLAIGFGNAAYQAGNIAGASMGAAALTGTGTQLWALALGLAAGALLYSGRYQVLERALIGLVALMSLVFLSTAVLLRPDVGELLRSIAPPRLPDGASLLAIALIGTTVVPYNLFLHASAVARKWPATAPGDDAALAAQLHTARLDTGLSVGLGGLVTLAILSTAATVYFQVGEVFDAATMGRQLEPLLGTWARPFFAAGMLAAGLTSAITAPLAAAFAVCGALGWQSELRATGFRAVWLAVLLSGVVFAALGTRPLTAIVFAQATNGLLLPLIAVFLVMVMNRQDILGRHRNGGLANSLGAVVVGTTVLLGAYRIWTALA